jgi:mRNA interferase RelE/StbE
VAAYSLSIPRTARKELEALPDRDLQRIVERIQRLAEDPTPTSAQKLSGQTAYRVRQGDYRIVYTVDHPRHEIVIIKIGHRREVYR